MIAFEEALSILEQHAPTFGHEKILVLDSLGRTLTSAVYAPINLPPFDQSAVDGFAFAFNDLTPQGLAIASTIRAEGQNGYRLPKKTCVRIMTGAPLPTGADTVVMKEHTTIQDGLLFCATPTISQHIRKAGGDVECGTLVAKAGDRVTPALIGLLLGLGIDKIEVFKQPSVTIIATGDELVVAPEPLAFGQSYYSVGPMIKALLATMGIDRVNLIKVGDDRAAITAHLKAAFDEAQLVLLTGGMSQGEYDFVRPALADLGVEQLFFQGKWRPGKPLYFGKKGETCIFGLPGNPVASFACVHIFVRHLLAHAFLWKEPLTKWATLAHDFEKPPGWTLFLRAQVDAHGRLEIAVNQESHQMFTLAQSNALSVIGPTTIVKAQSKVHYYSL